MAECLHGFTVPEGLAFDDLNLRLDTVTHALDFDQQAFEHLCRENGFDYARLTKSEWFAIIFAWYEHHLSRGGWRNLVADAIQEDFRPRRMGDPLLH